MNSDNEVKGIRAVMILDIVGRPPEHLIETLEGMIKNIDGEKGVVVIRKEIKKPEPMKENKEFYTTFGEIEIEADELPNFVILLFKYMPAHVEIISPELIALTNNGWNEILNELVRKLHGYDEISRIAQMEKQVLLKKIQELGGEIPGQQPLQTPESKKPAKKSKPKKKKKK